jgi:hypothetical protein
MQSRLEEAMSDRRQNLIDELGRITGELFAEGFDEADDAVKRAVLHGFEAKRVKISVEITLPPVHASFGVVASDGTNRVLLFEIDDPTHKPLAITQIDSGSDVVN